MANGGTVMPIVVGLVPARGGSKGVIRKNIRQLAGKPLIAWTIETALACPSLDRVITSTDDPEIAEIARRYGAEVPFIRPAELAQDDTSDLPVCQHAFGTANPCVSHVGLRQLRGRPGSCIPQSIRATPLCRNPAQHLSVFCRGQYGTHRETAQAASRYHNPSRLWRCTGRRYSLLHPHHMERTAVVGTGPRGISNWHRRASLC